MADFEERMMPGQKPYTPEERERRDRLVAEAADGDPGEAGEVTASIVDGAFRNAGLDPDGPKVREAIRTITEALAPFPPERQRAMVQRLIEDWARG